MWAGSRPRSGKTLPRRPFTAPFETREGGGFRLGVLVAVLLLHAAVLAVLGLASPLLAPAPRPVVPARLIRETRPALPVPPVLEVALATPGAAPVPMPALRISHAAEAPSPLRRGAAPAVAHFGGSGGGAGLGLGIAGEAGGGAAVRAGLGDFDAEVKRRILAGKRQPALAWDRRNTCVVNYTVRVGAAGTLAGYAIDPCAVPEINQAAARAIAAAAPFPRPPGGERAVRGALVFGPGQ